MGFSLSLGFLSPLHIASFWLREFNVRCGLQTQSYMIVLVYLGKQFFKNQAINSCSILSACYFYCIYSFDLKLRLWGNSKQNKEAWWKAEQEELMDNNFDFLKITSKSWLRTFVWPSLLQLTFISWNVMKTVIESLLPSFYKNHWLASWILQNHNYCIETNLQKYTMWQLAWSPVKKSSG